MVWMFPTFLLDGTPWINEWNEKEKQASQNVLRLALPILGIGWVSHYFFYDLPMGLEPAEDWFYLRVVGLVACCTFGAAYFTNLIPPRLLKLPAICAFTTIVYLQSLTVIWHGQFTWVFLFVLMIAFAMSLRLSSFLSGLVSVFFLLVALPNLIEGGVSTPDIATGAILSILIVMVVRTSYLQDVRNFLLAQRHEEAQQAILTLNRDFTSRLRSFIPKTIADRIDVSVQQRGMSVLEASVDVLEAKEKQIAVLFSDIRGFTQSSKDLHEFMASFLPEVKACTDAIERHEGIPRKIGDLVFAYFDDDNPKLNLFRAVIAGFEIARLNADRNATANRMEISRFILIDCGTAVVGNLGGQDSSVEITAIGSPVNFLARLDEVTKHPDLVTEIKPEELLLSEQAMDIILELLEGTGVELEYRRIDLSELGIVVRDFPETRLIFSMQSNDLNFEKLIGPYNYVTKKINGSSPRLDDRSERAAV